MIILALKKHLHYLHWLLPARITARACVKRIYTHSMTAQLTNARPYMEMMVSISLVTSNDFIFRLIVVFL